MADELTFSQVVQFLYEGVINTGLPKYQRMSWVRYCYHYSNISNIVSILESGKLYSRNKAINQNIMITDNASEQVIVGTNVDIKNYVRFYFRPKTPTQYNNEGIRNQRTMTVLNAHCPIPVFLLFNLDKVLTEQDCFFCDHSLAINGEHKLYSTPTELAAFPFSRIYHDGSFPQERKREIISARQAEIVIMDEFDIDRYLTKIMVRSIAEKEYLIHSLSDEAFAKYGSLIQIDDRKSLFFSKWIYLEQVKMDYQSIIIELNVGEQETINKLEIILESDEIDKPSKYVVDEWKCQQSLHLKFKKNIYSYILHIYLNDIKVYENGYDLISDYDLPF